MGFGGTTTETFYAPGERAPLAEVRRAAATLSGDSFVTSLLECVPAMAAVLNRQRQIVAANHRLTSVLEGETAEQFLGSRPGEVFGCVHHDRGPNGCGTSEACRYCGAVQAVLECQKTHRHIERECRLRVLRGGRETAMDLRLQVQPLPHAAHDEVLLYAADISDEKRREVLERTFFHDVLNTIGGLRGLVDVLGDPHLEPSTADRCRHTIGGLCDQLIEEVQCQRHLLDAERGELQVSLADEPLLNLVADVVKAYRHRALADGRELAVEPGPLVTLRTDAVLLRRVLGNLVKNGIEATHRRGTVTIGWRVDATTTSLWVSNPGEMSAAVQAQVFQRSFSTKEGHGRGVGTYSVKLFTEQYLGGQVSFTSDAEHGTVFTLAFPA